MHRKIERSQLKSKRKSVFRQAAILFAQCMLSNVCCIAFVRQRSVCELVFKYALDFLAASSQPELASSIASYRGGYSRALRRNVERELSQGRLRGLVSTNAMELVVDNAMTARRLRRNGEFVAAERQSGPRK